MRCFAGAGYTEAQKGRGHGGRLPPINRAARKQNRKGGDTCDPPRWGRERVGEGVPRVKPTAHAHAHGPRRSRAGRAGRAGVLAVLAYTRVMRARLRAPPDCRFARGGGPRAGNGSPADLVIKTKPHYPIKATATRPKEGGTPKGRGPAFSSRITRYGGWGKLRSVPTEQGTRRRLIAAVGGGQRMFYRRENNGPRR